MGVFHNEDKPDLYVTIERYLIRRNTICVVCHSETLVSHAKRKQIDVKSLMLKIEVDFPLVNRVCPGLIVTARSIPMRGAPIFTLPETSDDNSSAKILARLAQISLRNCLRSPARNLLQLCVPVITGVALFPQQSGEIVAARGRIAMIGAEHLLADCQRALVERPRLRQLALVLQQAS